MRFEAQAHGALCCRTLHANETLLPAFGKYGGLGADALRVVPERIFKVGAFADRTINEVGKLRFVQRIDVDFAR